LFYTGMLHETLDDYIRKYNHVVVSSPVKLIHYGYVLQTQQEAWAKMQRYLEINIAQMLEQPMDGRAYYNLALHFIEDSMLTDAMELLEVGAQLPPIFALPQIELANCYVLCAQTLYNHALKVTKVTDDAAKEKLKNSVGTLETIKPQYLKTAPGHTRAFFQRQPHKYKELKMHVTSMKNSIMLERQKQQNGV
jgi:hypothetical protein